MEYVIRFAISLFDLAVFMWIVNTFSDKFF